MKMRGKMVQVEVVIDAKSKPNEIHLTFFLNEHETKFYYGI